MTAKLRFDNVDDYSERIVSDDEVVTIGRQGDNKVALTYDFLSRHHAKIYVKEGCWTVEDVGSANGTFLRGRQLPPNTPSRLENGDVVRLGTIAMGFSCG